MNKKLLIFFIFLIIGFSYLFNIDRVVRNQLYSINTFISSTYINILISTQSSISKYFNQLEYIDQLISKNEKNQRYKTLYETTKKELDQIKDFENEDFKKSKYNLKKVKVLSYYKFNDHSKVILDTNIIKKNRINSLITYDGFSAGIVLNKDDKTIAYLNNNKKCNYAVFIGKENAPGITSGMTKDGLLIIRYIPLWKKISIDDEVFASGMDNIFPQGIKVGKVLSIKENEHTKEVLVQPYAKLSKQRYFYLGIIDD
ncbi:MAG: rod shape-determining protein MreC [Campylobacterota bacterium]|nr:rod shape-determining protein MreC [Campylobacterota bacterium]